MERPPAGTVHPDRGPIRPSPRREASSFGQQVIQFLLDERVINVLVQVLFTMAVLAVAGWMIYNYVQRGRTFTFGFLGEEASFDLAEGLEFSPTDPYARAFLVGVFNTIRVAVLGVILATILGLAAGIARLSDNWLISRIAGVYIEIVRNTPLLVQLFFLYFAVILKLPDITDAVTLPGPVFLSKRGIAIPWPVPAGSFVYWWPFVGVAVVLAIVLQVVRKQGEKRTGRPSFGLLWVFAPLINIPILGLLFFSFGYWWAFVTVALIVTVVLQVMRSRGEESMGRPGFGLLWVFAPLVIIPVLGLLILVLLGWPVLGSSPALLADLPEMVSKAGGVVRVEGGTTLSPEFVALLLGLVIYTGAFIAEVVRAGILSVPKGQTEAARAVGLTNAQVLRLVVLPQALRVIIPPLISQYLNLTKNSSLAIGIAFLDLYAVSNTMLNQSGRVVEVFIMIMASYLAMSLTISLIMNIVNRRIQIVER